MLMVIILTFFPQRSTEFKARLKLFPFSAHPPCLQDGTVPPSIGKRRPAPMFSLLHTLWKCDCDSWPLWKNHHEFFSGFFLRFFQFWSGPKCFAGVIKHHVCLHKKVGLGKKGEKRTDKRRKFAGFVYNNILLMELCARPKRRWFGEVLVEFKL